MKKEKRAQVLFSCCFGESKTKDSETEAKLEVLRTLPGQTVKAFARAVRADFKEICELKQNRAVIRSALPSRYDKTDLVLPAGTKLYYPAPKDKIMQKAKANGPSLQM